jgi:C-terminal processing protease CtpA/Prc
LQVAGRAGEAAALAGKPTVMQRVVLGRGHAMTPAPLAVLVNGQSASASEILAGALKDNGRASVIGDTATYGKGKIQSVYELADGSALFVTIARYKTPVSTDIVTPSPC